MFQTNFVEKNIIFYSIYFLSENRDVYEIMWKNMTHRWITTIYHISCCIQHSLVQHAALKMKPSPDK